MPTRIATLLLLVVLSVPPGGTIASAAVATCPRYGPVRIVGRVRIPGIREISGVVAGRRGHVLWAEQDSGNPATVYAIAPSGRRLAVVRVLNARNRDWEDIGYANGNVWVGDIGSRRNAVQLYWFPEPAPSRKAVRANRATFRYAGGEEHNAEAMFVDQATHKLFIVTKELTSWQGFVYRASIAGLRTGGRRTLRRIGRVTIGHVTGADIGPQGFIVRNLSGTGQFYRWRNGRSVVAALHGRPCPITVGRGESVAFTWWNRGLFTVPEGHNPPVRYVRRLP